MEGLIFILLIHFLADFGLQTHEQATNKSTSLKYLTYHVGVYSLIWWLAYWAWSGNVVTALLFAAITFGAHFVTDYFTSRLSSKFFKAGDMHNGFVVVGFDQMLHYIQLFLLFKTLNS